MEEILYALEQRIQEARTQMFLALMQEPYLMDDLLEHILWRWNVLNPLWDMIDLLEEEVDAIRKMDPCMELTYMKISLLGMQIFLKDPSPEMQEAAIGLIEFIDHPVPEAA